MQGTYDLPWGTSVGTAFIVESGTPYQTQMSEKGIPFFPFGRGDLGRFSAAHLGLWGASRTYVPAFRIARLYAQASEKERAFGWLEKAYERRETPLIHLSVGWDWDHLRNDPRFQNLLRQMNLPA